MKYIFTEDEFDIMLALSDTAPLYFFEREGEITDESIIRTTARLYADGRLAEELGKLRPTRALQEIFRQMDQSEYVISFQFFGRNAPVQIIYTADKESLIVLEKFLGEETTCLKLQKIRLQEFVFDLFENGMLPRGLIEERREAERLERRELVETPEEYEEKDILVRIRRIRKRGSLVDNKIDIIQTPIFKWIHGYEGYEYFYHIYSTEEMAGLLLKEIKGVEL